MADVRGKCSICGKPSIEKYRPFCSSRCSLVDLGKWFEGSYKIESVEDEEESDTAPNPAENDEKNE